MRRRGAHCRCRPRPRYRVRRPIFGLVHGNYPPGLAATYHFIPKQTTLILYRLLEEIAIRFSPFLRNFFSFFSFFPFPQRAVTGCFPPNGSKHDSGCIHFLRVFHGFPGKKFFSFCTMSGNIVVSRHWRIFSAHPIVCVQSVFSFFCPRGTVQRADSTGGKQGFLQMLFS